MLRYYVLIASVIGFGSSVWAESHATETTEAHEAGTDLVVGFEDISGALRYEPGAPVTLDLRGTTAGGSAPDPGVIG